MFCKRRSRFTTLILSLVFIAAGAFIAHRLSAPPALDLSQFHGTFLKKPRELTPFTLQGADNQPFTQENFRGQWTFLFFGFTHCGYICPNTMAELNKMYQLIEKNQTKPLPKVFMISVDPARDTLEKLQEYVTAFNPNFHGATGTEANIKQLSQEMGIAYVKVALPNTIDPKKYDIQHSGAVILINPEGKLQAFFTPPLEADKLADDYRRVVTSYR